MADKKISQLTGATTPLTGTEELAIVQGGQTLKATAQDVADLAGGGFSFSSLLNPPSGIIDIINATEGTSIPDSSTATYTKTVPLPFTAPTAVFGCFLFDTVNANGLGVQQINFLYSYGVTNGESSGVPTPNPITDVNSPLRFVAFQNYTQTFRAQDYIGSGFAGSFSEVDETGNPLLTGNTVLKTPTYTQLNNNLFGIYNGPFSTNRGIGISSGSVNTQEHSIIKAIYISGNNLVFDFKKKSTTTSETWTKLRLRVYNFS